MMGKHIERPEYKVEEGNRQALEHLRDNAAGSA